MYGESNIEIYIAICELDNQQECAVWLRKLKQGLCISLEVGRCWGEMGGRFKKEGMYVSLCLSHVEV